MFSDTDSHYMQIFDAGKRVHLVTDGDITILPIATFNGLTNSTQQLKEVMEKRIKKLEEELKEQEKFHDDVVDDYESMLEGVPVSLKQNWVKKNSGQNRRLDTGRQGDAEILACAVSGMKLKDIQKQRFTYNKEGHRRVFERSKIFKALSVNQADDHMRIQQLYYDYPSVFKNITIEQVNEWFYRKYQKWHKEGKK